jgi:hypothetical protein
MKRYHFVVRLIALSPTGKVPSCFRTLSSDAKPCLLTSVTLTSCALDIRSKVGRNRWFH